jgi:ribose transport system permease protein
MRSGLAPMNVQAFDPLPATGLIVLFAMPVDRFAEARA